MKPQPAAADHSLPVASDDWTFAGADTRRLTHCYHDYPARMIPQVAGKLLDQFGPRSGLMLDPYCGTGTSLVEGLVRGLNVIGTDLNPLARLISTAKTTQIPIVKLDQQIARMDRLDQTAAGEFKEPSGLRQLDFWFQPEVIAQLGLLRQFIDGLAPRPIRAFFQVAFSETVRECSNTRNEEFKLYRLDAARLEKFKPDVFAIMKRKLLRNRQGQLEFIAAFDRSGGCGSAIIGDFNTVTGIPVRWNKPDPIDIVVTSPPYGDSRTTVAYGQYSRLSSVWLGLDEPGRVDGRLMGGKTRPGLEPFPSPALNAALKQIEDVAPERAREVAAFYDDLQRSIRNVAQVIRPAGHACYVVGNRQVKGVELPTDQAVADFFRAQGFSHFDTFHRGIPNKRMPSKNSPGNVTGETAATMTREYIVVMRK